MLIFTPLSRVIKHFAASRSFSSDIHKQYGTLAKALQAAKLPKSNLKQQEEVATCQEDVRPAAKRHHQRKQRIEMTPNIWAYATAEKYNLGALKNHIVSSLSDRYKIMPVDAELRQRLLRLVDLGPKLGSTSESQTQPDVLANDININDELSVKRPRSTVGDVLLFDEGVVVMWNLNDEQRRAVMRLVQQFQTMPTERRLVEEEAEKLTYVLNDQIDNTHFRQHEILHVKAGSSITSGADSNEDDDFMEKYAISDAMCRSVKLAIRECALESLIDGLNPIVENLRRGKILVNKQQLIKKTGELFALRHDISLDSDLLDGLPDFYWDREQLEKLYRQASCVFCIEQRTKVINERLNYCLQLGERLDGHLNATHSVRLERIIIFLIAIEVGFAVMPYVV